MPVFSNRPPKEEGTILLMAAVTILVVVGMLALAVDIGYLMGGRTQLQNAVDASALAGAQGLRTAIEAPGSHMQQSYLIRKLAKDFAAFNSLKKVGDTRNLVLDDNDIAIDFPADYPVHQPRILIKYRTSLPTIFGNVFGVSSMAVSAGAIASTTFVDGGTGMISGCWRPIMIPDTFNDKDGNTWAIGGQLTSPFIDGKFPPSRGFPNDPLAGFALETGDYYVSRYAPTSAASDRNAIPNLRESLNAGTPRTAPTSIRDAQSTSEVTYYPSARVYRGNLMGQRMFLRPSDYRLINFASSGLQGDFPTDPVQQINRGCCVPIRIGQKVSVYAPIDDPTNITIYQNFVSVLQAQIIQGGTDTETRDTNQYRYAQTQRYPTPNSNPRVIPVLMCSPIAFSQSKNIPQFYVTNFGAFFVEGVRFDGSLIGFFVREVVTAGTTLEPKNEVMDDSLLPISVNLIR